MGPPRRPSTDEPTRPRAEGQREVSQKQPMTLFGTEVAPKPAGPPKVVSPKNVAPKLAPASVSWSTSQTRITAKSTAEPSAKQARTAHLPMPVLHLPPLPLSLTYLEQLPSGLTVYRPSVVHEHFRNLNMKLYDIVCLNHMACCCQRILLNYTCAPS